MSGYGITGPQKDVYLSSRVRLARNIVDYPYGSALDKTGAAEIAQRVKGALCESGEYSWTDFSALAENEKLALVEKNVASPEMLEKSNSSAIAENKEKGIAVLVGEEDHIRVQCIKQGLDIKGAFDGALEAERLIDKKEKLAFSRELGYLTHCPTNLGTGMRASVMMFLPMLTATGEIRGLDGYLQKIGLTVLGEMGEGSRARGCLYQISNRLSLGVTEEEICSRLLEAVSTLADHERSLRESARGSDISLEDRIMRSLGTARYARQVSTDELFRLYSDLRLGIALGYIDKSYDELDKLRIDCMSGALCCKAGRTLSAAERDRLRAETLRSF